MNMKKIITLFTLFALVVLHAFATKVTVQGVVYGNKNEHSGLKEGEAAVIDYTDDLTADMVIEDEVEINGVKHRVVEIIDGLFTYKRSHRDVITSLRLPAGLKKVGRYAFEDCKNLETITGIPTSNLDYMGNRVFNGTKWIKSLAGEGVYLFGGWAISHIGEVPQNVVMPAATIGICEGFLKTTGYSYINVKTLQLNEGLKELNYRAFGGCYYLKVVNIPASVEKIDSEAFEGCGIAEYNVAEGNTVYSAEDGILYNIDKTKLLAYPAKKDAESFTTPAGVTELGSHAFYGSSLKKLVISEGITYVPDQAIREMASLDSLSLPSTLTKMGYGTFYSCNKLKTIVLHAVEVPTYYGTDLSASNFDNTILYVPEESLTAYQADAKWGKLNNEGARDNIQSIQLLEKEDEGEGEGSGEGEGTGEGEGSGEGDTTAIESVYADESSASTAVYDLAGRPVKNASKGIYIMNGKKVYVP